MDFLLRCGGRRSDGQVSSISWSFAFSSFFFRLARRRFLSAAAPTASSKGTTLSSESLESLVLSLLGLLSRFAFFFLGFLAFFFLSLDLLSDFRLSSEGDSELSSLELELGSLSASDSLLLLCGFSGVFFLFFPLFVPPSRRPDCCRRLDLHGK
jgi:hypothetical protein